MEPVNIAKSFEVISRQVNARAAFAIAVTCLGICGAYLPTNTALTMAGRQYVKRDPDPRRKARSGARYSTTSPQMG
jgi:hypothetical protein